MLLLFKERRRFRCGDDGGECEGGLALCGNGEGAAAATAITTATASAAGEEFVSGVIVEVTVSQLER